MYNKLFSTGTKAILAGAFCAGMMMSCHKDSNPGPSNPGDTTQLTAAQAEDSLKYLMYQIMQVTYGDGGRTLATGLPTYYWYSSVAKLDPFSSSYPNADTLLNVMKRYAINPGTGAPYDHYSFLDRNGTLTNKLMNGVSSATFAATNSDFGMEYAPVLASSTGNQVKLFVLYADKNSPSGKAGINRGCEITSVNGTTTFTNTNASLQFVYNAIFASTSTVSLGIKRADGVVFTTTLSPAAYNINPVLFDTVYTANNKKVGYFGLYTFASVFNDKGQATDTKTALDQTFAKFAASGIKNLIVDLRYNGGGATTTAEYLDSAIAPAAAAGKTMYSYKYNDKLTQNLAATGLTETVKFPSQTGGLSLENVFFITSNNTASASELTLNNLRPYMKIFLVGEKTYGKPVGFIDFNISAYNKSGSKKYLADLYAINFSTHNANGQGDYYTGIDVDKAALDYVNVPWGATAGDDNLIKIMGYINTGAFPTARAAQVNTETVNGLRTAIPNGKPLNGFNGMVDYRLGKEMSTLK
jgi:carboxyl-terminal processing protease